MVSVLIDLYKFTNSVAEKILICTYVGDSLRVICENFCMSIKLFELFQILNSKNY